MESQLCHFPGMTLAKSHLLQFLHFLICEPGFHCLVCAMECPFLFHTQHAWHVAQHSREFIASRMTAQESAYLRKQVGGKQSWWLLHWAVGVGDGVAGLEPTVPTGTAATSRRLWETLLGEKDHRGKQGRGAGRKPSAGFS